MNSTSEPKSNRIGHFVGAEMARSYESDTGQKGLQKYVSPTPFVEHIRLNSLVRTSQTFFFTTFNCFATLSLQPRHVVIP
jgi:hypothetical protein